MFRSVDTEPNQKAKTMSNPNQLRIIKEGAFVDFVQEALRPTRKYDQQKKRAKYVPERARFKLKFWYRDGNESVHYSYDHFYRMYGGVKERMQDEQQGLTKLLRLIKKNEGKFIAAVVWCVMHDDTTVMTSKYNFEVIKYVHNRDPKIHRMIQFEKGKLVWTKLTNFNR